MNYAAFGGGKASSGEERNVYKLRVKGAAVPDRDMKAVCCRCAHDLCSAVSTECPRYVSE